MAQKNEFVEHVTLILSSLIGDVESRAMFGGYSYYHAGHIFAMTVGERLYFKVDKETEGTFEGIGSRPFSYESRSGKSIAMSYWEAPEGTMEEPEALRPWAMLGVEAANRAALKRKPKKK